jgi:hypothetical protein
VSDNVEIVQVVEVRRWGSGTGKESDWGREVVGEIGGDRSERSDGEWQISLAMEANS